MLPPVGRLGDVCTGHGCFPSRGNVSASPNVFTNSIPTHRRSDAWASHCCGPACHGSVLASGSTSVFVNNLDCSRIGDPVACGSAVSSGSPNVFAGG
jgi:uncharacterized Zn-binding protein involved in type VI secretion